MLFTTIIAMYIQTDHTLKVQLKSVKHKSNPVNKKYIYTSSIYETFSLQTNEFYGICLYTYKHIHTYIYALTFGY